MRRALTVMIALASVSSLRAAAADPPVVGLQLPKSIAPPGDARERDRWHEARYAQHKKAIEDELGTTPIPDWAGRYGTGAKWGQKEFLVAPSGLYVRNYNAEADIGRLLEYGVAHLVGNRFILRRAPGLDEEWGKFVPGPYIVGWGYRRFAVDPRDMLDFVNAVNAAGSSPALCNPAPMTEMTKCVAMPRADPAAALPAPLPVLAAPWGGYLLKTPIEAKVTKQVPYTTVISEGYRTVKTRLVIDKGADAGLKPGMMLYRNRARGFGYLYVTVESVDRDAAWVEYSGRQPKLDPDDDGPPSVGQDLSTRLATRHPPR